MNRKIEVIENKEVGRKKMSLSYAERDNFQNDLVLLTFPRD